jgi:hypothetical protein
MWPKPFHASAGAGQTKLKRTIKILVVLIVASISVEAINAKRVLPGQDAAGAHADRLKLARHGVSA